jgi:multiple sugar transport system ATP-binding protein
MATVRLANLTKRYPRSDLPAVHDVSFSVGDGEFVALLGPSGCGKSTTLRMIAGLEEITAGELFIDERQVNTVPAKDRDIAMVFQSYALYPHMTIADNLAFGLRRRGVPGDEIGRRVNDVAAMLGLTELLARKPHSLSGGQRQRVALGRAIVRDPKVFLFDEPLSNLDAALRLSTRGEIVRQHQRLGATMIYVTHDQVEAMTMSQRMCIMNGGQVVQMGKPLDIYRDPADTFVARFLGSPPMNLIDAALSIDDENASARFGEHALALAGWRAQDIAAHAGKPIVLGVRPEHLRLRRNAASDNSIAGTVATVEPLGAETLLTLAAGGANIIARLGADTQAQLGERLAFFFEPGAAYLFDATTARAISKSRTA